MGWIENTFRTIMFCLDKIVYSVIGMLYELFMTISNIAVIGQDTISEFTQRIYILIGIFMIFKITISMISWYANPDSISDSRSGSGALIKRIVISLVCLAIVPWIFTFAYRIQYVILNENIIGNLVLGGMTNTDPNESLKNGGNIMAIRTFQGFFYPENYENGKFSDYDNAMSSTSWDSATKFIDENLNIEGEKGEYKYHYQALISTIAGVAVAAILLIFCVDVAIRSVKLAFLQLIAPIPVLSYIDQKKGDKIFNNWMSECVSTYLDVFIRLLVIYFAIFLIGEVSVNFFSTGFNQYGPDGNITAGSGPGNFFAQAFIIIGILLFAKQLPDLLKNILGIKSGSKFTLNPIGKALGIGLAAGGAGAVGGFAANLIAGKGLGSAIAGAASAGSRSMYGGFTSGGKKNPFSVAKSGIDASNLARNRRETYKNAGYGLNQRIKDRFFQFADKPNKTGGVGKFDDDIKNNQRVMDNYAAQEQALRNAQAIFAAEHSDIDFAKDRSEYQNNLDIASRTVKDYEDSFEKTGIDFNNLSEEDRQIYKAAYDQYTNAKNNQQKALADLEAFDKYKNFESEITKIDDRYEKLKAENSRMKKALDANNGNKNKK